MSFFEHRVKGHRPSCVGPVPVGIDGIAISFCFPYIFTVPLSASGHGCWYCEAPIVLVMGIFQKAPRPTCKDGTFFFSAGEGPGQSGVLEDCPAGWVVLGSRCFRAATSASWGGKLLLECEHLLLQCLLHCAAALPLRCRVVH